MPWVLITKIDLKEIYNALEIHTINYVIIFGSVTLLGGLLLIYYYRRSVKNNLKQMYETENKFKVIFERSHSAIVILKDEKIVDCNPKAEKFFGLNRLQLMGKNPAELSPEFQEDNRNSSEKATELIASALKGKSENFEWIHLRNGIPVYADVFLSPIVLDKKNYLIAFIYDITSRKKNEEILKESENKFSKAFKFSPQAMIITSLPDGNIIDVNDVFLKDSGFSREELIGHGVEELNAFIEDENRVSFKNEVVANGFVYGKEILLRTKYREILTCIISASVIRYQGQMQLLSTILNITDRKKIEEALAESEIHFRTLADSGQALIWSAGKDIKSDYFNKTWLDFTGHSLEQEINGGWLEMIHPDDIKKCYEKVVSSFNQKNKFSMEYRLRRYDGEYRWILDDGSPRYNSHGKFIGYIHQCLDITDRKVAQQKLESAYTELKNLYDNLPVAVFSYDIVNNKILQASLAHKNVFGYSPEDFYRNPRLWYEIVHPEDKPILDKGFSLLSEGKGQTLQYRIKQPDGNIEWIESRTRPVFDKNKRLIQIDGTASNITELKATEQRIKLLSKSIEQSPVSVVITDPEGNIQYVNQTF